MKASAETAEPRGWVSDLLRRDPAVAQLLVSDEISKPRSREDLNDSMLKIVERHSESPEPAINAVRSLRLRELFRLAAGDVLGTMELADVGRGLSDLTGASVDAALRIAMGADGPRVPIGIVAMGSWGGGEMKRPCQPASAVRMVRSRSSVSE